MRKKITRSDRQSADSRLYRPRKIVPPQKRKNEGISTSSASAKKIKVTVEDQVTEDLEKHYMIIDFLLVFSTIATLVKCVKCDGKVNFLSTLKTALDLTSKCQANAVNRLQMFRLVQE